MIGKTLGHYRIVRELGSGGMGEVYAAEDQQLHRLVALKVLSAPFGSNHERRERFEREAHAVAALNHPNIVTIYSMELSGTTQFLTVEIVEGRLRVPPRDCPGPGRIRPGCRTIRDILSRPKETSFLASVPGDGRMLYLLRRMHEADIWMATLN